MPGTSRPTGPARNSITSAWVLIAYSKRSVLDLSASTCLRQPRCIPFSISTCSNVHDKTRSLAEPHSGPLHSSSPATKSTKSKQFWIQGCDATVSSISFIGKAIPYPSELGNRPPLSKIPRIWYASSIRNTPTSLVKGLLELGLRRGGCHGTRPPWLVHVAWSTSLV